MTGRLTATVLMMAVLALVPLSALAQTGGEMGQAAA